MAICKCYCVECQSETEEDISYLISPSSHGQRVSIALRSQDSGEEVGAHEAPEHLPPEAILDGVALQQGDREPPRPAQVVRHRPLPGPAVVLPGRHVRDPVHRLGAPMTPNRLAEPPAARGPAEH